MQISPKQWGPPFWKCIHFTALGYPNKPTDDIKIAYKNFFIALKDVIPCHICGNHYIEFINKFPLDDCVMSSKTTLFNWTVDLHNDVNVRSNKPIVNYETALKLLSEEKPKTQPIKQENYINKTFNNNIFLILIILFFSLIFIVILYKICL